MGFAATPDVMLYVFGGLDDGKERVDGTAAVDGAGCVGRRHAACRTAAVSLSLSLAEGARVWREEICRHACTYGVVQWAVYVPPRKELVIRWYSVGREIGRRSGSS
jgi:hypothetical protein